MRLAVPACATSGYQETTRSQPQSLGPDRFLCADRRHSLTNLQYINESFFEKSFDIPAIVQSFPCCSLKQSSTGPDGRSSAKGPYVPRAIGTDVIFANCFKASGCSTSTGSSMKSGRCGSRAFASCLAIGLCNRPWKSSPASNPTALTAFSLSTALIAHVR